MKTPEQIADEVLSALGYSVHNPSRAMAAVAVHNAIQADRAQRREQDLQHALEAARTLMSDDGENGEYDRALVELICDTQYVPGEDGDTRRAWVEDQLGMGGHDAYGDLVEAVAQALDGRVGTIGNEDGSAERAAAVLRSRERDEDAWLTFFGPMLDDVAQEYGGAQGTGNE